MTCFLCGGTCLYVPEGLSHEAPICGACQFSLALEEDGVDHTKRTYFLTTEDGFVVMDTSYERAQ